jgi:hypothetical protein
MRTDQADPAAGRPRSPAIRSRYSSDTLATHIIWRAWPSAIGSLVKTPSPSRTRLGSAQDSGVAVKRTSRWTKSRLVIQAPRPTVQRFDANRYRGLASRLPDWPEGRIAVTVVLAVHILCHF